MCLAAFLVAPCYGAWLRSELLLASGHPELVDCGDLCSYLFCFPCSLAQDTRAAAQVGEALALIEEQPQ
jgi:hypothetical protein